MKLILIARNTEVGETLRKVIDKKVKKIEKYFKPNVDAHVTLSVEGYRNIVEVTIPFDGIVIRAEETNDEMQNSIDRAFEKIEKQVHKHRTKLEKKLKEGAFKLEAGLSADQLLDSESFEARIIKNKRFTIKPMSDEEALTQMDLLGHSFFVFLNAETNEVNVLYKRKDGNFGLIEPVYK